jgi:anthranilate synthase component 1
MDTCIVLRIALIKDSKMYVQAGAGIVADSGPAFEQQECIQGEGAVPRGGRGTAVRQLGKARAVGAASNNWWVALSKRL